MHGSEQSGDRFFSIRNWTKFQHYKKRNPPWIRLYASLLRERNYQKLADTSRSHLIGLFVLASQQNNLLPDDQDWLRHELCTKSAIDLKTLNELGWIEFQEKESSKEKEENITETDIQIQSISKQASVSLAPCVQDASIPCMCGSFQNVKLSQVEIEKLSRKFGRNGSDERIEALSVYMASKGKKYRSHYATILSWESRNGHLKAKTAHIQDRKIPSLSEAWTEQYGEPPKLTPEELAEERKRFLEFQQQVSDIAKSKGIPK